MKMQRLFAFPPDYNSFFQVQLTSGGEFSDTLTAGNAQIYRVGCSDDDAENVIDAGNAIAESWGR